MNEKKIADKKRNDNFTSYNKNMVKHEKQRGRTTMIIRPIAVSDAENFVELSKRIDESGFMLYEPGERETTVEQQRKLIERILSEKKSIFFVAEDGNKLVGFIAALGDNLKRNQHSAYLVLGILEEHQGQGVATKLFKHIFEWAKEVEISRLELTVIKDNLKAFNLYRKMGFIIEGEKVHSLVINGKFVNEYYLYKLL
jgi:RimJ/RimL family protein N-acetyltransferase